MFGTNQNTTKTTRNAGLGAKARKILLGLSGLAVAGVMMGAAPAMARDRDDFRGNDADRRDVNEHRVIVGDRDDFRGHDYDHREVIEHRVFVPDRYELRTRFDHGCAITERVLIQAGHWEIR